MAKTKKKPAKAKNPKPRTRRPKQPRIFDDAGGFPDVDAAAELHYDRKVDHKELTQQLKDARIQLAEGMIKHDLITYLTPTGIQCERTSVNNVKTKKKDDSEESQESTDD